jgi:hypothetical protein
MAFDDLDDAVSDQRNEDTEQPEITEKEESPTEQPTATTKEQTDPLTEPAFEFSESRQIQFYPRERTYEAFEDTLDIEVKRLLRERGIRNESGRELHEAVLRVAIENPSLVAQKVAEERQL